MELSVYCGALDSPARAAALTERLLAEARTRNHPLLYAYTLGGDVLSLGRFHVVPPERHDSVTVGRRKSGGRVAPLGDGYLALALASPHAAALVAGESHTVLPGQVLNRAVRGLLGALESLGVAAYYPGREIVTAGGRVLASLGFETAGDGATLVEACVAIRRSFAEVSAFADRADPGGVVPVDLLLPEQATCVAEAGGRAPDLDELVAALSMGYASRLGLEVATSQELRAPDPDPSWLDAGRLPPHLDRHALAREMLGVLEVYAACESGRITDVRVCGDVIAPSVTIARIEASLRGAPVDRADLVRRVTEAAGDQADAVLGVRSIATIGELAYTACA
jgi:lipoate-protein ligase A